MTNRYRGISYDKIIVDEASNLPMRDIRPIGRPVKVEPPPRNILDAIATLVALAHDSQLRQSEHTLGDVAFVEQWLDEQRKKEQRITDGRR